MSGKNILALSSLTASILLINAAQAQEANTVDDSANTKSNKLDEMIIIANRTEIPLSQVAASVSVLNADDLQNRPGTQLSQLLRTLPSVRVSNNGGVGKNTAVRIRGEEGYRTKTYIDGIDISDVTSTQVQTRFGIIMNSQLERVEVLRGPQGMMYGADSGGGVVSITSKQAHAPLEADVSAEAGRYDTQNLGGNIRGKSDLGSFSVSASQFETDGFNARDIDQGENADLDGNKNTTVHANGEVNLTDNLSAQLTLRNVDNETEFDGCGFPSSMDCVSESKRQDERLALNYNTAKTSHEFAYSKSKSHNKVIVDGSINSQDIDGTAQQLQYVGQAQIVEDLSVVYGLDYEKQSVTNHLSSFDEDRKIYGAFAEIQTQWGDNFFYNLGARYDDTGDFDEHLSYRLNGAYLQPISADNTLKFKGGYSTGYRAPSLFEVAYNTTNPFANQALLPDELEEETSKGWEIGVELLSSSRFWGEVVWFDTTIENEIFFDLNTFAGYQQGQGKTSSKGLEIALSYELLDSVTLTGNYTYNDTEAGDGRFPGSSNADPRLRRPENVFNLGAEYRFLGDKGLFAAYYRHSADAVDYDFSAGELIDLDDYGVLDLVASYQVLDALEVYAKVENATDEQYQEIKTYNTANAAAYVGFRYSY